MATFMSYSIEVLKKLLQSSIFWTVLGAIATIIGVVWMVWKSSRKNQKSVQIGRDVDELEDEYSFVAAQEKAIRSARIAVTLYLHTIHSSTANWKAQRVNTALSEARRRGLSVRVLAGNDEAQLAGAYELQQNHDIEVRLNPELLHSDLRFLKIDEEEIILGIADTSHEQFTYSPSSSWAYLKTSTLADVLEREFQRLWLAPASADFYATCAALIAPLRGRITVRKLSADLGIGDTAFLEHYYRPLPLADVIAEHSFIFYGKSASGKSTLMRNLSRATAASRLDLEDFVLPLVFRYGNENVVGERIRELYVQVVAHARDVSYDFLETGSELAPSVLPRLFDVVRAHRKNPVLVHCCALIDEAMRRNSKRARPIPVEVIQRQNQEEETGAFRDLCKRANVPIIELAGGTAEAMVNNFIQGATDLKLTGA